MQLVQEVAEAGAWGEKMERPPFQVQVRYMGAGELPEHQQV
jgi:hypothetical protein